jgi:hypothetical protein
MNQVPFDQLTFARFSALVKTRFRVQADATTRIELELAKATQLQSQIRPNSDGTILTYECFSLTFNGPGSRCLEQKMYEFQHDELGTFSLFMVPIGKTRDSFQYEVVFNRLV